MHPHEQASGALLARRLRELRTTRGLSQRELAGAFGKSVPLISSWESATATPPADRLREYATFFATDRSVQDDNALLLADTDLTPDERRERDQLLQELVELRGAAKPRGTAPNQAKRMPLATSSDTIGGGSWYFPDQRPITIVSSKLRAETLSLIPDSGTSSADYIEAYKYSDLDALIELHGHIRAVNPASLVTIRVPDELNADDLTSHVVLLGGVDLNDLTESLMRRIDLPVRQVGRPDEDDMGFFAVGKQEFHPSVESVGQPVRLVSDVALFYRGLNPNNHLRTLTICNGMFARGTYGVVRALTDARFRDRNERFVDRFTGDRAYCVLSRVEIQNRLTLTPDWTSPSQRLFEWSEPDV